MSTTEQTTNPPNTPATHQIELYEGAARRAARPASVGPASTNSCWQSVRTSGGPRPRERASPATTSPLTLTRSSPTPRSPA